MGHGHETAGQVDHRAVVVALLEEGRTDGQRNSHVGDQLVAGVGLSQGEPDPRRVDRALDDEHDLVADHLDHPATERHHRVVSQLLEPGHDGRQLLVTKVLAEDGEPDHVGEADGHDWAGALGKTSGSSEHGPAGGRLQMAAPHVLEHPSHSRNGLRGPGGEAVGVNDAVTRRGEQNRVGAGAGLRLGDAGHRRTDDPRHLHG